MYEEASVEDLVAIFSETVVLYQKKPVFISSVNADKCFNTYSLENMKEKVGVLSVTDKDFDFLPVPLGFCNHNKDALFLQRIPKRQYKQGLCKTNLKVNTITDDADGDGIKQLQGIKVRSLSHCIGGLYPTLENAISLIVKEGYRSVAFARKLAIDTDLALFYTDYKVGMVDETTGKFSINRTMKHLERVVHARY